MEKSENVLGWDVKTANMIYTPRIIDHLKDDYFPSDYLHLKERIAKSERLSLLRSKETKNTIVELPTPESVIRHFSCSGCCTIPFPWVSDPNVVGRMQNVFICRRGHPVCRTCCRLLSKCVFSMKNYIQAFDDKNPSNEMIERHTSPISNSVANSCETIRICSEVVSGRRPCGFLTDMICSATFACKYFYRHCGFYGRGKDLMDHEATCLFEKAELGLPKQETLYKLKLKLKELTESKMINKQCSHNEIIDDDDTVSSQESISGKVEYEDEAILNFDLKQALAAVKISFEDIKITFNDKGSLPAEEEEDLNDKNNDCWWAYFT